MFTVLSKLSSWYNFAGWLLTRDQFSAEHGILSRAAEFARFRIISMFLCNSVLASDKGKIKGKIWQYFGWIQVAVKYIKWHSGSNGRNIENIELSLSEILPFYLVDNCICRLQLPVGLREPYNINYCMWAWNNYLEKFTVENCSPYCWPFDQANQLGLLE